MRPVSPLQTWRGHHLLQCNHFAHTLRLILLGIALALRMGGGHEGSVISSPALGARANQAGGSLNPSILRCLTGYLYPVVCSQLNFSEWPYSSSHFMSCLKAPRARSMLFILSAFLPDNLIIDSDTESGHSLTLFPASSQIFWGWPKAGSECSWPHSYPSPFLFPPLPLSFPFFPFPLFPFPCSSSDLAFFAGLYHPHIRPGHP